MRFNDQDLAQAIAEFTANAVTRIVPAAGYNKDITIYGVQNGTIQAPSGSDSGDASPGSDGG